MMSVAPPISLESTPASSPQHESPTSARSRRLAMLPPLPPPESQSPPVPARSPLRPTPRTADKKPPADPASSKRKHALIELLTSERAYASDLALIRDIHIPLALGQPVPFPTPTAATLESLPSPPASPHGPPMTKEDTRIIFGNVEELAIFSEMFCEKLEEALCDVLDPNGDGKDTVGELFLSMIPLLSPPYTTYITRHPSALAHLNALPQSPALITYLAQTHTLAQSYTHAWDIPSLLIKPVQRLLKYPLLLSAIIEDTEPGEARDRLREARDKVEEVARGVNEGRRRWEVVRDVLDGKHPPPVRIKSIRGFKIRSGSKDDQDQLEILVKRLHECETFAHDLAKGIVDWTMSLRDTIAQLEHWSTTFGRVIGLGKPHGSEALDLFIEIVSSQITPIWISLDAAIQTTLLPKLARLLATTSQPLLLISHMYALQPQHLQLLDLPLSKARPTTSLLDASQSYLALNAQLRAELPRYIELLERGFLGCVGQFTHWQARFWHEVRAQWVELWDALGVEGDMTAGAADTVKVWWDRWEEIDTAAAKLGITKPRHDRALDSNHQGPGPAAALATAFVAGSTVPISSSPVPSIRSRSSSAIHQRDSVYSIDLELDPHVLGVGRVPAMTASPETYSPPSTTPSATTSVNRGSSMSKWDSNRPSASRRASDKPTTARQEDRQPTPRISTDRPPSTRNQDRTQSGIPKKSSVDSAAGSALSSPLSIKQSSLESRASEYASGSSLSASGSRSSLNHRLSTHSFDDMHTPLPSTRTSFKSQPTLRSDGTLPAVSINGAVVVPEPVPPARSSSSNKVPANAEERGRIAKKPSMRQRFTNVFRSPSKRPHLRASTPSFTVAEIPRVPSRSAPSRLPPPEPEVRSSEPELGPEPIWPPDVPLYACTVIHPFSLPDHVPRKYRGLPFLVLVAGNNLEILSEEGDPRTQRGLPIRPEDENCEDCLLVARHEDGTVGWALASFLALLS